MWPFGSTLCDVDGLLLVGHHPWIPCPDGREVEVPVFGLQGHNAHPGLCLRRNVLAQGSVVALLGGTHLKCCCMRLSLVGGNGIKHFLTGWKITHRFRHRHLEGREVLLDRSSKNMERDLFPGIPPVEQLPDLGRVRPPPLHAILAGPDVFHGS